MELLAIEEEKKGGKYIRPMVQKTTLKQKNCGQHAPKRHAVAQSNANSVWLQYIVGNFKKMKLLTIIPLTILFFGTIFPVDIDLTETYWALIKIENSATNKIFLADTTCGATLHFANERKYNGYSGCNQYFGNFIIEDSKKISMDNPFRTKRGCPTCQLGESLFEYYPRINQYRIQADTLTLLTDNKIKITYKKIIKRKE